MSGCDSSLLFYFMRTSLAENQANLMQFSQIVSFSFLPLITHLCVNTCFNK